jgi:hypothetical protein
MSVAFPTVALIGKYKTPEVAEPVMRLARFLETRGVKVLLDRLTAAHIQNCPYEVLLLEDLGREADLAIVIGGVRVECDDLLIADQNGLVVIPRDYIQAVWKHIQDQA